MCRRNAAETHLNEEEYKLGNFSKCRWGENCYSLNIYIYIYIYIYRNNRRNINTLRAKIITLMTGMV